MNWKSIEYYDLPDNVDILLRIESDLRGIDYIVGNVKSGIVYTHSSWCGEYDGFLCDIHDYKGKGIKAMYYIDPREIML